MAKPKLDPNTMSTAHFEKGIELLSELNDPALFEAFAALDGEGSDDTQAFLGIIGILGVAAKAKLLRRMAAVATATVDELEEMETNQALLAEKVHAQARRPFKETLEEVKGFFTRFGISDFATLGSLARLPGKVKEDPVPDPKPAQSGG